MVCHTRQESVCGPKKIDCDMYSNRHRLKAPSPALDTFTRKIKNGRSAKAEVCMRQHKNGSCAADHTCIQIGIACSGLEHNVAPVGDCRMCVVTCFVAPLGLEGKVVFIRYTLW